MKLFSITLAALALAVVANAAPGHGGGGFGGGHGGGFGGGHGGGFGGGHGGGFGGGHGGGFGGGHGGGFHGGHGGYHGGGHWRGGVWAPVYGPGYGGCGWNGYCGDDYVSGSVACAPEVVQGNVVATDRTMAALVATPEFATAKTLKSEVAQVAKIADPAERADAYMQLAGIQTSDKAQIAAFIGARDAKGAWITDLQRNADLSSAQAETVAQKLQIALRGNLQ